MPTLVPDLLTRVVRRFLSARERSIPVGSRVADGMHRVRGERPSMDDRLDVTVTDGVLIIHAARAEQRHTPQWTEFRYGTLRRSVRLPAGAIEGKIAARLEDGVLTITVPTSQRVPIGRPGPTGRSASSSRSVAPKPASRSVAS